MDVLRINTMPNTLRTGRSKLDVDHPFLIEMLDSSDEDLFRMADMSFRTDGEINSSYTDTTQALAMLSTHILSVSSIPKIHRPIVPWHVHFHGMNVNNSLKSYNLHINLGLIAPTDCDVDNFGLHHKARRTACSLPW